MKILVVKNDRLERLSDEVRKGHPIDFLETLEVIEYQNIIKDTRQLSWWGNFKKWLKK